jgi:filamentous hemagglutinin
MNNVVSTSPFGYYYPPATSGVIRRSGLVAHSHVLTSTTQASRAYTSAFTHALVTRPDKHLLNHHIYTSNQPFTHVEPAQPAIEFIVSSSINLANALQSLSGSASASSASATPISAISLSGSIGQSKSQSSSTSGQTTAVGSTLAAGKNLTITANGDPSQGQSKGDGNLTTVGATLSAGKEATLDASGDLNLLASQNTSATNSTNSSSNASMGATLALGGSQNGLSFQAGAQGSKGKANGAEVTYNNTTITVGSTDKDGQPTPGTLNLKSGGNTTLRGAVASADTLNADIKGNLTIESLQDKSTYDSKQTSAGAGVSICIPPICYGTMVAINVNAGKTKINGDHLSVGQQSALRAGDGGFNVKVGGKTDLVGGAITSSDKADKDGKNSFASTGGVTTQDLQNTSALNASSVSVSINTGSGSTGGMAGFGSVKDKQASVTQSGITGVAGNKGARTGDAETGLKPVFTQADVDKINKSLATQTAITGEFGKNAAKFVGDTAGKKQQELEKQAKDARQAGNTDEANRLSAEAGLWAEGGAYRVAMHIVAGAMGGGVNGAAGAAASSLAAPVMDKVQAQMQDSLVAGGMNKDVAKATASLLTAGASAAIAGAAGGVQGAATGFNTDLNNRQLHPKEAELIKDNAKRFAQKLYGTATPTADQIEGAMAMLVNTAQSMLDNNMGVTVPYSKQADDFLQSLKISYMQQNGTLNIPGTSGEAGGSQQLFYANVEQKNQDWLNRGLANPAVTGLIIKTPLAPVVNNPTNDPTRDRLTGLPLDENGRYSVQISVDGKNFAPKYFPCAVASCLGNNLDASDPATQTYLKAMDKKIFDDINKAATIVAIANPAGVGGTVALYAGPISSVLSGMVEDQTIKALFKEGLQAAAGAYIQRVYGFTKELATRVTSTVDLAGGWQAFVDRIQIETNKDKK